MEFEIPYFVQNGGDGSAGVVFAKSLKEATRLDDSQSEGWGESSASKLKIRVEDGKVKFFIKDEDWNDVEVELQPLKEKKKK